MSQAQLARALGQSPMWVSDRLRGIQPIDLDAMERIAKVLGVEVTDLLPGKTGGGGVQAIAHYLAPTVRTIEQPTRPRDNRPSGHPAAAATTGVRRTAHLPRTTRSKAS
jgi:transcriptional regulator with XRE-family HTH domain